MFWYLCLWRGGRKKTAQTFSRDIKHQNEKWQNILLSYSRYFSRFMEIKAKAIIFLIQYEMQIIGSQMVFSLSKLFTLIVKFGQSVGLLFLCCSSMQILFYNDLKCNWLLFIFSPIEQCLKKKKKYIFLVFSHAKRLSNCSTCDLLVELQFFFLIFSLCQQSSDFKKSK